MVQNRLTKIWEGGVATHDAFDKFASGSGSPEQMEDPADEETFKNDDPPDIKTLFAQFGRLSNAFFNVVAEIQAPKKWVLDELTGKRLMAIGFTNNKTSLNLEIVPVSLCKSEYVDWKSSKISGMGICYIDVRICPFENLDMFSEPPNPRGRPNYKDRVWSLIADAGLETLQTKNDHNKTGIAKEIHEFGRVKFPHEFSEMKPDKQTIIRHYNSYLKRNYSDQ